MSFHGAVVNNKIINVVIKVHIDCCWWWSSHLSLWVFIQCYTSMIMNCLCVVQILYLQSYWSRYSHSLSLAIRAKLSTNISSIYNAVDLGEYHISVIVSESERHSFHMYLLSSIFIIIFMCHVAHLYSFCSCCRYCLCIMATRAEWSSGGVWIYGIVEKLLSFLNLCESEMRSPITSTIFKNVYSRTRFHTAECRVSWT